MSLATRCTACGTIFRIVEDQLRVSDGWVRCGRCAEIFDARELLFDIEQETPPPWPAAFSAPQPERPAPAPEPTSPPRAEPIEPGWAPLPQPADDAPVEESATAWSTGDPRREPHWADDSSVQPSEPAQAPAAPAHPMMNAWSAVTAEPAPAVDAPVPEFMKRAASDARWQRPGVRLALALTATLLAFVLAAQVIVHFRDALAASYPSTRSSLQALCGGLGCDIRPWRRIDSLSLESTSLNPLGSGASYRLNLSLRNKSGADIAPPWVELSLTDAAGAPFARRVMSPELLTPHLSLLGPDSEHMLSFNFGTNGQRVSGYSVNIFYP